MSKLNPEFYAPYDYQVDRPRARHNLSTKLSTTMHVGLNIPIYHRRMYRGDDFDINLSSLVQTIVPFARPLLDCFELRFESYWCPLRNYYGWMDNNSKETTEDVVKKSPKWTIRLFGGNNLNEESIGLFDATKLEDVYSSETNSLNLGLFNKTGSLFQYFGLPVGYTGDYSRWAESLYATDEIETLNGVFGNDMNAEPFLCYLDIIRSYHINNQYGSVPVYSSSTLYDGAGFRPLYPFDTSLFGDDSYRGLDDLFTYLRYKSSHRDVNLTLDSYSVADTPLKGLWNWLSISWQRNSGFFPVQHRPDLWRNLLSSSAGSVQAKVNVVNGSVVINELREQNKFQKWVDSLDASSGRYGNILSNVFGKKGRINKKMPVLLGVTRYLLDPSNITAMAQTGDYELGEKASNIDKFNTGGHVSVKASEDGYLMILCNITPLVTYSQGVAPNALRTSFNDDFNPFFQRLGYQSVPRAYYSTLPSIEDGLYLPPSLDAVVGKSVKWLDERTDVNHSYGDFTAHFGIYSDMVLNRYYGQLDSLGDDVFAIDRSIFELSPYVNPLDYNDIFAVNTFLDNPFSVHVSLNIKAKRPILKRWTPSLE